MTLPLLSSPAPAFCAASRISVIIPHLNQPVLLDRCLRSLIDGTRAPDEIIVIDNGSAVSPDGVCAAYPGVQLLTEHDPGPGPARNKGIAHSTGEILAFIDADCLADAGWLTEAENVMKDPGAQILGGDVRISYVHPERLTILEAYESIYAYRMDRYIAREGFTGTGNLVVRRDVALDVGPFAGLAIAEDRDWGQRATRKGYRIRYVKAMRVYHPARQSFTEMRLKWDRHSAHDYATAQQTPVGKLRFMIKTFAMALSPLAEVPRILCSDRIAGLRNRGLAFVGLTNVRLYRTAVMARLLAGRAGADLSGAWNRK